MKILFLLSSLGGGGAERVAAGLASAWADRGHDVTLVPTFGGPLDPSYSLSPAVRIQPLSGIVDKEAGKLKRLRALRVLMRTERPDVVVSFLSNVNVAAIIASVGLGIPVVASERVYPPLADDTLPRTYRALRHFTYPFATALVGQTEPAANWLRERGGNAKIAVIPNSVSLPLATHSPVIPVDAIASPCRKIVLWAGRLVEQKRPDLIVRAFARAAPAIPEWDLVMLGDGPLRNAVETRVFDTGLAERIHLPGFAGNLGDWYERASIYALTSAFEGFPNTLLEAMAHGAPSIAFDVLTGPRELSDHGRRLVLLADEDQEASLASAITELAVNGERRGALGETAREVASIYSEDAVLSMWDDLLSTCVVGAPSTDLAQRR